MHATLPEQDTRSGTLHALAAFGVWAVVPVFWHLLDHVDPDELLAHRLLWSAVILGLLTIRRGALGELLAVARDARRVRWFVLSALLIGANWYLYLRAVQADRVVEASLGYFVNPLVNVLLGLVFLHERLRPAQWMAVALACAGVALFSAEIGGMPWMALALAVTFGLYSLVRKQAPGDALVGSTLEIGLIAPVGAAFLAVLLSEGGGALGHVDRETDLLLAASGVVTTAPLLWFAEAARRLPLTTLAFLQYVSPVGQLLLGVLLWHEPIDGLRVPGFALIWAALVVFTLDARRAR